MEIQDYNIVIKHIPGKQNDAADALSRPEGIDQGENDNQDVILLPESLFTRVLQDHTLQSRVKDSQNQHKEWMQQA